FGGAHAQSVKTLDPVVVTASKFEEPQGQATAIVDVIDRQQIEASGAANITELLDQVSGGLLTRQYGRLGADASFDLGYLGGASVQRTLVLVDGVRMNDIDGATIRWGQVPLDAIERIEVRKAGGGVLFGDRALGGVVNIITKRTPGSSAATVTLGSFGTRVVGVQTSQKAGETSFQIAAQQAQTDGYRADSEQDLRSLSLALSQQTSLGNLALQLRGAYENVLQPYSIALSTFQTNPRATAAYSPTRSKRRGTNGDLIWRGELSEAWSGQVRWSREQSNSQAFNLYENDRDTLEWTAFGQILGGRLVTGIEAFEAESASNRTQRSSVSQNSTAIFLNLERPISNNLVNFGVRHQKIENNFYNTSGSAAERSKRDLNSWSLGGLSPLTWGDLRYSLQSSFAFPHADQLYTYNGSFTPLDIYPNVRPMRSEEFQAAWSTSSANQKISVGTRHIKIKDEIGQLSNCAGAGIYCNTNLYDTRRIIFYVEGSGRITQSLNWQTSVDRVEADIQSGSYNGNQVPMVPNLVARASLSYSYGSGRFQIQANHRGKMVQSDDSANSYSRIPERLTLDIGYGYATGGQELTAWIRNLADHQYFDFASGGGVAPADGRSIELRFKQSF
ncbi:MAG: hypothetical protein RL483_1442, partial [Pseudomonadota bacterium]